LYEHTGKHQDHQDEPDSSKTFHLSASLCSQWSAIVGEEIKAQAALSQARSELQK
jgi:hypothetical protein